MAAADIEGLLLKQLDRDGALDSGEFAAANGWEHNAVVGVIKSLEAAEMVVTQDVPHSKHVVRPEAEAYATAGSPEAQVFAAVPAGGGLTLAELKAALPGDVADLGFRQAMQQKWVATDKSSGEPRVVRKVEAVVDTVAAQLAALMSGGELPAADLEALTKKRKFLALNSWKTFAVSKGPQFALQRKKQATELTAEMLSKGTWRTEDFKAYNFDALGLPTGGGALHPLLKVRTQYRRIFTSMGFEEMPTNNYVESSFWNFDALFQPQQHPARDAHDTFFLTRPAASDNFPEDYLARVKEVHEHGGYGSAGYGYCWKRSEAQKNLLRTHTTAVSSRMLYRLAQEGFRPAKYFSIDRVFRNEAVDRTHLAEFHQVEGLVCDRGLTLGDLIGTLREFFSRLGLTQLRFKPAYNPYTEPSMEIFSYSEELGKWIEVGNSGMFRPEMLQPMGLPPDVRVIAWGVSLERPTMILYGIGNIRDLFGHKVSLNVVRTNPICRLGW
ncbi:MAG: tRNA synthetases class II core domain (F)-domain-containing protein [Monoraphidium minutum]|nr:MAG: tRNA synthetases class II core domain (F)-domain-containing protein [Monoraphidium minutum]